MLFMLETLTALFNGRSIRITSTNERARAFTGVCKMVRATPGEKNRFEVELENGQRFGFVPDTVTSDWAEGEMRAFAGGRLKIQLIQ